MFSTKKYEPYLFALIVSVIINIASWKIPFFWDTLLTSTITDYLYQNGWNKLILPTQLDAGHPPFFYAYIVLFYKLLGEYLWVAHVALLLPNILAIIGFIKLLAHFSITIKYQYIGIVLFNSIPAILTQQLLVSYDMILLTVYLWSLIAITKRQNLILGLLYVVLCAVTQRGIIAVIALCCTHVFLMYQSGKIKPRIILKTVLTPILFCVIWYTYRYWQTGVLFQASNNWSEHRTWASLSNLVSNSIGIARVLFDFGSFILSILLIYIFTTTKQNRQLIYYSFIPFMVFAISFLPLSNPICHRYFLVVYALLLIPILSFLQKENILYSTLIVLTLNLGHLQLYKKFSNGWDCTIAHLAYYPLRNQLNEYLQFNHIINKADIGTIFPMNASNKQLYLEGDAITLQNIHQKNIYNYNYILQSNISNDFTDEQLKELQAWDTIWHQHNKLITLTLYKNNQK